MPASSAVPTLLINPRHLLIVPQATVSPGVAPAAAAAAAAPAAAKAGSGSAEASAAAPGGPPPGWWPKVGYYWFEFRWRVRQVSHCR